MKKFYIMLLALLVTLVIIIPSAVPVMAKNPQDNKPWAWVNGAINMKNDAFQHISATFTVKFLSSDGITGTTVGTVVTHLSMPDEKHREFGNTFVQDLTNFGINTDGSKWFEFAVFVHQEPTDLDYLFKWKLVDVGEPGKGVDMCSFAVNVVPPDNPLYPLWYYPPSNDPTPQPFDGNIQVHLPYE